MSTSAATQQLAAPATPRSIRPSVRPSAAASAFVCARAAGNKFNIESRCSAAVAARILPSPLLQLFCGFGLSRGEDLLATRAPARQQQHQQLKRLRLRTGGRGSHEARGCSAAAVCLQNRGPPPPRSVRQPPAASRQQAARRLRKAAGGRRRSTCCCALAHAHCCCARRAGELCAARSHPAGFDCAAAASAGERSAVEEKALQRSHATEPRNWPPRRNVLSFFLSFYVSYRMTTTSGNENKQQAKRTNEERTVNGEQ